MNPRITRDKRTLTVVLDDDFSAEQLHAALCNRQWVRFNGGHVQLADVTAEPKDTEHDRLIAGAAAPCFLPQAGKSAHANQTVGCDAQHHSEERVACCYVQHLGAYQQGWDYARLYQHMRSIGFYLLRSPRSPDNKLWEVWYLPGMWSLTGPLEGADRAKLVQWLFENVSPGTVTFGGETWALTVD